MPKVNEVHELSIIIPVCVANFYDNKEIEEVFDYAFKRSRISNLSHYPNTFKKIYDRGDEPYKFTICVESHNSPTIPKMKEELEELVDVYNQIEKEYLRYRAFGNIECRMIIRKGTMRDD